MDEVKTGNKSKLPITLIVIAVIAIVIIATNKNSSTSNIVDKSGNIIISESNPFSQWFGKEVPDFTVTDIDGNKHSISDYRGKNLMVIFWATWCPPCRKEIPHLIELRKQESEDNLAMLAISTEKPEDVKTFAKNQKLNYTVATLGNSFLPRPFAEIQYIPTTFFIDTDGRIKTVVVQSLNLEQIKTILNAKSAKEPESINDNNDL